MQDLTPVPAMRRAPSTRLRPAATTDQASKLRAAAMRIGAVIGF